MDTKNTPAGKIALTNEEHRALLRIHYATSGEDPLKCGLEYIGRLLDNARANAENAATRILPEVADVKLNPAPAMESLLATGQGGGKPCSLAELCEIIFDQLNREAAIKPAFALLRSKIFHGETRLETFANDWFVFLFGWNGNGGLGAFMQKKVELANALGKTEAASKLLEAFNTLLPNFALTDWEKDTKRLANEITPDDFHRAFRTALKLDAEATDEINNLNNSHETDPKKASNKPYDRDLNPERSKADARDYMARLVLYVWCEIPKCKSKALACDYVFQSAKNGDRLYSDCTRARNLLKTYGYNPSTIQTEAAKLHAELTTWRKKKGLEWPDNWREMVKKSAKEDRQCRSTKRKRVRN